MEITVVKSNKGNDKLIIDGYTYHVEKKGETIRWCCAERKSMLCKGRVLTNFIDGKYVIKKMPTQHCHSPLAFEKEIFKTNNKIKSSASTSGLKPSQIIRNSIVECKSSCRVYLPSKQAQKIKISRVRSNILKEPCSLDDIIIPESIKYLEGELFVLSEKSFGSEKIILLGTESSLKLLSEANCWLIDGTFEVVPSIMRQLFSIHGQIGNEIVPLIFCIMSSKSTEAYREMFYELCKCACEYNISLNPKKIISDFEKASVKAAKEFFPSTSYKGCLFHFGKIIWRRVQTEGLSRKYGNDEDFSMQIRMLKSLAFVPPEEISNYFKELQKVFDKDAKTVGKWFQKNYITGNKKGRSSGSPQYSPEFWSIFSSSQEANSPRTQNSVEAWHRRLKVVVGKPHIGVYQLISELSKELIVAKSQIVKMRAGKIIPLKRQNAEKNKRLHNVMQSREDADKLSFLKNIAYNISLD